MARQEEIKQSINQLKTHFETNLNNKYVKNILLKMDLPTEIRHSMNIILEHKTLYFDSKGTLDDIYSSIRAISQFVKEVKLKVLQNVSGYTGSSFMTTAGAKDPNDKILFQMAVKNYPMNITILAKMSLDLLSMVVEYDNANFPNKPAYQNVKNFDEIEGYLARIIKE